MNDNKLDDTTIFEMIADPGRLAEKYPDGDQNAWLIAIVRDNSSAISLARRAAKAGGVVGLWGVPSDVYAVGIYHGRVERIEDLDFELGDTFRVYNNGEQKVVEMGANPICYPMLGAWNWGNLPRLRLSQ